MILEKPVNGRLLLPEDPEKPGWNASRPVALAAGTEIEWRGIAAEQDGWIDKALWEDLRTGQFYILDTLVI